MRQIVDGDTPRACPACSTLIWPRELFMPSTLSVPNHRSNPVTSNPGSHRAPQKNLRAAAALLAQLAAAPGLGPAIEHAREGGVERARADVGVEDHHRHRRRRGDLAR